MPSPADSRTGPPSILEHNLNEHFPELLRFESTAEMEASDLYNQIRSDVNRIMNAIVLEPAGPVGGAIRGLENGDSESSVNPPTNADGSAVRALAWNLERGIQFEGIIDALKTHDKLKDKDLLLLSELDYGMARSGNRFVARDIARELNLHYAFAPVYIPLQKGSGVESEMSGMNTVSIHGLALFSRYPIKNVHAVPLPNGKDKMWGKEKRIGYLRAIIADIEHPNGEFRAICVHLDAHCSRSHRHKQMRIILDHLDTLSPLPTLIGGDWNTTTFNSQSATRAILGYWRRVMMGPKKFALNHLPYPDRYFERGMFAELESRGFEYQSLNESGAGTLHYHVESLEKNTNLRDWVPEWCFPFIFWAAGRVGGHVSARLDWFAGKGLRIAQNTKPGTVGELVDKAGRPLSDHDAITLDFCLTSGNIAGQGETNR